MDPQNPQGVDPTSPPTPPQPPYAPTPPHQPQAYPQHGQQYDQQSQQPQVSHNAQQQYDQQYGQQRYSQYPEYGQQYPPPQRGGAVARLLWALLGFFLLAMIGGGILLVMLLQPRGASNTTTRPSGDRTAVSQPTQEGLGPVAGGAGDTVRDFYNYLKGGDYNAAFNLLSPDAQAQWGDVGGLSFKDIWELELRARGGSLQSISIDDVSEQGDTASVTVTLTYQSGETNQVVNRLVRSGNRWLISEF